MKIRKSIVEIILITLFFLISCAHPFGLYLVMIISSYYLFKGRIGIIKLMFLLILRTIISPGLFFDINTIQIFQVYKWLVIIGGSTLIVINDLIIKNKFDKIFIGIFILYLYFIISSFFFSINMTVSILKITSYLLPLLAFYFSKNTINNHNLINWTYCILKIPLFISLFLITTSVGYLRNGIGFQGIFNNPNMLGIVTVLTLGIALTIDKKIGTKILFFSYCILLVILSSSRTSLISIIVIIIIYLLCAERRDYFKYVSLISVTVIIFISYFSPLKFSLLKFFLKGQSNNDILYSRNNQLENFNMGFNKSPIFGNGFGVPVIPNNNIPDNYIVEAGNLVIALIMFGGLVGLFLYLLFILLWIKSIDIMKLCMFASTILISMGEMVLFSSNSIGLWCSLIWVMSLKKGDSHL